MITKFLGSDKIPWFYNLWEQIQTEEFIFPWYQIPPSSGVSISNLGLWQPRVTPVHKIPRRQSQREGLTLSQSHCFSWLHPVWGMQWDRELSWGQPGGCLACLLTKAPVRMQTSTSQGLWAGQTWRLTWPLWQLKSDKDVIELGISSWQFNGWL